MAEIANPCSQIPPIIPRHPRLAHIVRNICRYYAGFLFCLCMVDLLAKYWYGVTENEYLRSVGATADMFMIAFFWMSLLIFALWDTYRWQTFFPVGVLVIAIFAEQFISSASFDKRFNRRLPTYYAIIKRLEKDLKQDSELMKYDMKNDEKDILFRDPEEKIYFGYGYAMKDTNQTATVVFRFSRDSAFLYSSSTNLDWTNVFIPILYRRYTPITNHWWHLY